MALARSLVVIMVSVSALPMHFTTRRGVLASTVGACAMVSPPSWALAPLVLPSDAGQAESMNRNANAGFAKSMATGMQQYEVAVRPIKQRVFAALLDGLPSDAVVVELGIGTFPNAPFYTTARGLDIVGIEPNDAMAEYARAAFNRNGLADCDHSLRIARSVGEALPFADASVDVVACTLTLCSVADASVVLAEVRRVLKPVRCGPSLCRLHRCCMLGCCHPHAASADVATPVRSPCGLL